MSSLIPDAVLKKIVQKIKIFTKWKKNNDWQIVKYKWKLILHQHSDFTGVITHAVDEIEHNKPRMCHR